MISFIVGLSIGVGVGALLTSILAIGKIRDHGRECSLCRPVEENRKLGRKVTDLQFALLVSETELLLNFDETGERKIFSSVGQA